MKKILLIVFITIFSCALRAQSKEHIRTDTVNTGIYINGNITYSPASGDTAKVEPCPERFSGESFFSGSFLGALLSGLAAIFVFATAEAINKRRKRKKDALSIEVIASLLQSSVEYLNKYVVDLNGLKTDYENIREGKLPDKALPYREPYAIIRLTKISLEYLSELMAMKNVPNFSELLLMIDHIHLVIQELNKAFADSQEKIGKLKRDEVRPDNESFLEIYDYLVKDIDTDIREMENAKIIFGNVGNKLKK